MKIVKKDLKFNGILTKRKQTKEIILHCTASTADTTAETIHRMHINERKWLGIAYHYVIRFNGDIETGRPLDYVGGHTLNHNEKSVGVVYCGGVERKDGKLLPKDTRTPQQKQALYELVEDLLDRYNLTIDDVHCHNEFANKACPSFSITEFRNEYNQWKITTNLERAK